MICPFLGDPMGYNQSTYDHWDKNWDHKWDNNKNDNWDTM